MPHDPSEDETRAADLLPPDTPPDEPDHRPIAERRVVGWSMSGRLMHRVERRPAGNSRRFWRNIEEDDPFLPKRALRVRGRDEPYPAERLTRVPATAPPPQSPRADQAPTPPKPKRLADAPVPTHTRDTRVPAAPTSVPTPRPEPTPPPAPIDRTPPRPEPPKQSRSGRIRVSRASNAPKGQPGMVRKNAEEIRAEKEAARKTAGPAAPPPLRSLDSVLGALGELQAAEALFKQGIKTEQPTSAPPPPKPKKIAQPAPAAPAAPQQTPPVDRTPPKPTAKEPQAQAPKPDSAGGLDDLFGGGQEGRVRIGKRTTVRAKPDDSEE